MTPKIEKDEKRTTNKMTPTKSEEQFKYQSGIGNEFATEAVRKN